LGDVGPEVVDPHERFEDVVSGEEDDRHALGVFACVAHAEAVEVGLDAVLVAGPVPAVLGQAGRADDLPVEDGAGGPVVQVGGAGDVGGVGDALADGDLLLDEVAHAVRVAGLEQVGHPGVDGGALDAGPGVAVAGGCGAVAARVGERGGGGVADFGGAAAALHGGGGVGGGVGA